MVCVSRVGLQLKIGWRRNECLIEGTFGKSVEANFVLGMSIFGS